MNEEQQVLDELRFELRRIRGCYTQNAREGKFPLDPKLLAEFDVELEKLNARAKSISAKR